MAVVAHTAVRDPPQADVDGQVDTLRQQLQSRSTINRSSGPAAKDYVHNVQLLSGL